MALMYMTVCIMDFAIFPIMFTIVQFWETAVANDAFRQWAPLTLQSGGLFHVALGAVLGVTAYGRTQEKVAGVSNAPTTVPTSMSAAPGLSSTIPSTKEPVTGLLEPEFRTPPGFALQPNTTTTPAVRRPVTPNFNL